MHCSKGFFWAFLTIGIFGCSSSSESSSPSSEASVDSGEADSHSDAGAPQTYTIQVGASGFSFSPKDLTIRVGDTVHWDFVSGSHTVVSGTNCTADGKFCSPDDTNCATTSLSTAGGVYEYTFSEVGVFPYFCIPHCAMGMVGSITVNP